MPDPATTWEDEMLEQLARAFPYPPAPDVSARVLAALPAAITPRWRLRALAAGVTLILVAVGTLVISDDAREAVADFLGIAVQGERIKVLPTAPAGLPTPLPEPVDIAERARPVTLSGAAEITGVELATVSGAPPLAVYVLEPANAPAIVIIRYEGFDLWQFRTSGAPNFEKGVIDGRIVEETSVDGRDAYWISGGQRLVTFLDNQGTPVVGAQRTVLAPTLLWHDGERYLRIEGISSRDSAIAVAESVR